jgi:CDP-glycerol glycerophosphotransferase (TagB/SpsB family)
LSPFYYLLLFAGRFVLFPFWWLCGLLPRRMDLWVFGSWGGYRFADNAASFFRYCHEQELDGIRLVWISRDRAIVDRLRSAGYEAHLNWSLHGMAACLRAGVHLFDCFAKDTNFWLSRGAIKINLWSGVPMKTFEREIDVPGSRYYRLFHGSLPERIFLSLMMPWHVERPDLIIATSQETAAITRRAFDVPAERVVVTGFPRNDALLGGRTKDLHDGVPGALSNALSAGERIFLYLPTFRDSGDPYYEAIDWPALNRLLARYHARLFCKFHPVTRTQLGKPLSQITELPQDIDIYPLLPHVEAMVSDYSSVIFDYMLLGRPIIYFMPDLDQFVRSSRRLSFEPADIAVGPICADHAGLMAAIEAVATGASPAGPNERSQVLSRLHAYIDANSAQRVLLAVMQRWPVLKPATRRTAPVR